MANIVRRDPLAELSATMDRMFDGGFSRPWRMLMPTSNIDLPDVPIELSESEDDIEVKASLPGVKPEDIQISLQDDDLMIKADFREETEDKQKSYYRRELQYGSMQREIHLPTRVKADSVDATFQNGVLRLRMPKSEEVKARQIKVKAGDNQQTSIGSNQQQQQ